MDWHYLHYLIEPRSVAVFGASERADAVGRFVFDNLRQGGFAGPVYAVNPKYSRVAGQRCFAAIGAIDEQVDLAVIATPAATVPGLLHECGEHGVRAAVVLSAGLGRFAEAGGGMEEMLAVVRRYQMRLLGPNCLGLVRPGKGLNATFSNNTAAAGRLALVSQSGALCTAILDWAKVHHVGFSLIASIGDAADVGFGDLLDFLALDPDTNGILLYVEGLRQARSFMSGLRAAARMKPVVVVKAGRHGAGSRAAVTHTGAMMGADDVFDAALRRAGVVRALTVEQLFAAAQMLATHQRVQGNRLAVVTNGGGPGVMAADRAVDQGLEVAGLGETTIARLDEVLPKGWSRANPVDVLGDAAPGCYREAVAACLQDPGVDGVLAILTPQAMSRPEEAAEAVIEAGRSGSGKPVLTSWMGEEQVTRARDRFLQARVPVFAQPEAAVEAFAYLYNHQHNQQLLMQVPGPVAPRSEPDIEGARLIIDAALAEQRELLGVDESRALLRAFDIPVVEAVTARSAAEALIAAETLGFPVAMKVDAAHLAHKSDAGGVRLNISDARSVRGTYHELVDAATRLDPQRPVAAVTVEPMVRKPNGRELLIGVSTDAVFGPVISFAAGGTAVELLRDRAVTLPPLNRFIAADLIGRTRAGRMLEAFRNMPPADMAAVEHVLLRVSEMTCELEQIHELDINPLIVDEHGAVAVDVRIVVRRRPPGLRRYAHMAIHPYPGHLAEHFQLADGTEIRVRPIRPEDAQIEQSFVRDLSAQSRYLRFMHGLTELTPDMLVRFTQIDYDREMAFVALVEEGGREREIAVARYIMNPDGESCEFAIVVADQWQHRGIGMRLMQLLIDAARRRGLRSMVGEILAENTSMQHLVQTLGFEVSTPSGEPNVKRVTKSLFPGAL